ncbi:MAG: hydrogenase maturation nickel metallochaperone HypA [Chitinivibrionales bacterium]|nr:hydrogenase maturation nickel metallochaperone HypA [Chitinivibrionales bacterium]MBD3395372.1 hydrogenase maturation nickel metallochaperone HypA [Chitinivibrionales bacterium]
MGSACHGTRTTFCRAAGLVPKRPARPVAKGLQTVHEFSIVESILDTLGELAGKNRLARITSVTLTIGRLRQVVPETLRFAFEAASKDTVAHGARLELEFVDIRARCTTCGAKFRVENNYYICGTCNGTSVELTSGDELIIQSVEGEEA